MGVTHGSYLPVESSFGMPWRLSVSNLLQTFTVLRCGWVVTPVVSSVHMETTNIRDKLKSSPDPASREIRMRHLFGPVQLSALLLASHMHTCP